jgi:DNA repair protein RecO (recombination protein O)
MQWTDDAFVLSARPYGEGGAVVHVLARGHGRHAGLVRGGSAKQARGVIQPGNRVLATWMARLEEQLGILALELTAAHAAMVMADPDRLAVLSSACAMADLVLPEREPHPHLFAAFEALVADLAGADFASSYVRWELILLAELGYGLDLSSCAATGSTRDLAWVSPKSGRAVSAAAGAPYAGKLLPLPNFLVQGGRGDAAAVAAGLALTGHFLDRLVLAPHGRAMPPARTRLVDRMGR